MRKRLPLIREFPTTPGALGRREVMRWLGAVAAARALPACSSSSGPQMTMMTPPPKASFLTTKQQEALAALADYVFPPDDQPGGSALGVVGYVETLLTALDGDTAMIFAGGPYSGREPFSTADGVIGSDFPPDSFTTFVPLDRYREAAWKLRLYGSAAIPGGGINDAIIGVTAGLRNQVPQALDAAIAALSVPLDGSTPAAQVEQAWNDLPTSDKNLLTELVIEGCFSSPEYGGNAKLQGFAICNFEGDVQPRGYSLYDAATGSYNQIPDHPVSTENPGADPAPLDAQTEKLLETLVTFAGGKVYF
jgi:Gluconate 2-dehydrogenase subunit 3